MRETLGMVMTYQDEICDARYSKACGGLTEDFMTAWDDTRVPYLVSISDASVPHPPIRSEEEAARWIMSAPEAFCHTEDKNLLERILPDFDRETTSFFRWTIEYSREELEEIVREKSGFDFGALQDDCTTQPRRLGAYLPVENRRFEEKHGCGKGARNTALALPESPLQQRIHRDGEA